MAISSALAPKFPWANPLFLLLNSPTDAPNRIDHGRARVPQVGIGGKLCLVGWWPSKLTNRGSVHTVGMIGNVAVIVAHTWPKLDSGTGVETGRIISARKATAHERKAYEEGDF